MSLCGTTFDEDNVPPWTRGDFRGVMEVGGDPQLAAWSPALLLKRAVYFSSGYET
jgi:hypothetical protein